MSDLNIFHGKMSVFVFFPLFGFTLVIKLRSFDFESYWNVLIFFLEKRMVSDLIMLCEAVSALVFEQNVCNKLRNKNFTFYLNSLIFLNWGTFVRSKFILFLSLISLLWHYCRNSFEFKTSLLVLEYIGIL